MLKKIINIFFLILFSTFIFLVFKYYLSEKNIVFTNKSRLSHSLISTKDLDNLPLLINDTDDIIINNNDIDKFKKERKKRFWENLISNLNE